MYIWPLIPDTPRAGETVVLQIGSWPVESGQSVRVVYRIEHTDGGVEERTVDATWQRNASGKSYWRAIIGPFQKADRVTWTPYGRLKYEGVTGLTTHFHVRPKLYLALLWHQHQPCYKDCLHAHENPYYLYPWVRLHALRDYYAMAGMLTAHPDIHLTINLTPALLQQIEDYAEQEATDRSLELTLKPAETLTVAERNEVLSSFFEAHWHNQIIPHPRYMELFTQRWENRAFALQDIRDLQMWFNLAWFGKEFREGTVTLATGETASARRFVEQGSGFRVDDIQEMVAEQFKILRAVIAVHRQLQERGQIEVSTTPFYHPILPLIADTDQATLDRPGTALPERFAHPEDAEAQVQKAVAYYARCFGRPPRGMWPAEGAVSQYVLPFFTRQKVRWIATDQGVLARSGRWGYRTEDPDALCRPYRAEEGEDTISVFFRDTQLADAIGFRYGNYADPAQAAQDFLREVKERFAWRVTGQEDRILLVALDGENPWGGYTDDARPFLHSLYDLLERDAEVQTVSCAEFLEGNPARGVAPHGWQTQAKVYDLFTGSWIDEPGSAPGADLGTWIGETEENRAWELLRQARTALAQAGATPETRPEAFEALYAAEGSDWFWWFGDDQDSGEDSIYDELFRMYLETVYRRSGQVPPEALRQPIIPPGVVWTPTRQPARIAREDRLTICTNCPGFLTWWVDEGTAQTTALIPAGGVMAGVQRYRLALGPFPAGAQRLQFQFRCACAQDNCRCQDACCHLKDVIIDFS